MNGPDYSRRDAFRSAGKWLAKIGKARAPAIVLGASCNALSFARSLGRRGIPVLMLDSHPQLATYTRFAKSIMLPPVQQDPEPWLSFLEFVGSRLATPAALFSTADIHTQLVVHNSDMLERYFRFLLPSASSIERIMNKRLQYETAKAVGIAIPVIHYPESFEDAKRIAGGLIYPVLLKPYNSHAVTHKWHRKILAVHSRAQLIEEYGRTDAMSIQMMIHEIVPGDETALIGYLAFWDRDGRERAWLTKGKLRQHPPGFGDGCLQRIFDVPEVAVLSRRLLGAFDYRGMVGVEFKRDARDGIYRLMEINARTVLGNQLAITAGVDFPWIAYQYLNGADIGANPIRPIRSDTVWIHEGTDLQTCMALRKSGSASIGTWIHSLCNAQAHAVGAWNDPLPLIIGISRYLFGRT